MADCIFPKTTATISPISWALLWCDLSFLHQQVVSSSPWTWGGGAFTTLTERPWWEWENGSQQGIVLLLCSLGHLHLGPWGCYAVRKPDFVEGTHTRQCSSQLSTGARCGSPRGFQAPSLQRHPQVWSCLSWDLRHPGTESTQPLCALFKCLIRRIHDHIKMLLI